jgi:Domain of unknown function (DUF4136)
MIRACLFAAFASLTLSACVIPTGPVEVTRFHRAAEGFEYGMGTYAVKPAGDSLSLSPYLAAVAREMQRVGYGDGLDSSDVVAEVAVDIAKSKVNRGAEFGVRVQTTLHVRLLRHSDDLVIWEGRASQSASATSPAAQPGIAASKLAAALFQDFPGESGATISVP